MPNAPVPLEPMVPMIPPISVVDCGIVPGGELVAANEMMAFPSWSTSPGITAKVKKLFPGMSPPLKQEPRNRTVTSSVCDRVVMEATCGIWMRMKD